MNNIGKNFVIKEATDQLLSIESLIEMSPGDDFADAEVVIRYFDFIKSILTSIL